MFCYEIWIAEAKDRDSKKVLNFVAKGWITLKVQMTIDNDGDDVLAMIVNNIDYDDLSRNQLCYWYHHQ